MPAGVRSALVKKLLFPLVSAMGLAVVSTLVFGSAPASAAITTATVTSGSFQAVTYNVAGLPEFLSSAVTPRKSSTQEIGRRIAPYDIVNVQEDFNYHAALYSTDVHPYRTATSGGAGIGSGLNTVSYAPYAKFQRVKWKSCNFNGGDCLTPKGFTYMRVSLPNGATVDVYNLHADAGSDSGDMAARTKEFAQLSSFMASNSAGQAVLILGDTNTRYTRVGEPTAAFVASNGLTDAWVQLEQGGKAPATGSATLLCADTNPTDSCEVVDKVFYRSSSKVTLAATSYHNAWSSFLTSDGKMLSDHPPIVVGFTWTANR